jgi:hypothetical protein
LPRERLNVIGRCLCMLDRSTILEHLAEARRHVAKSEQHLAHQREIIAERERDGHDTTGSKQLLAEFEGYHRVRVSECDRLEKELAEAST